MYNIACRTIKEDYMKKKVINIILIILSIILISALLWNFGNLIVKYI